MTEPATRTRDEHLADVVSYENAMREGAESEKSAVLQNAIEQDLGGGVWGDAEFRAFIDSTTLKQLFFSEAWVFILCDLVAMKISSQPLRVMTGSVVDGKFVKKPAEGHPLQNLIEMPNPFQAYSSWMYCLVVDLTLLGNAVLWYASQANYLMLLPGEGVMLDIGTDGKLLGYKVAEAQAGGTFDEARKTTFAVEDITHMRRPNPSSLLWGLSPFIPGRKSVLFNRYSQDYLNSFYQKGAMPGFALEMDKEANERVAMRLLRSFENAYTGRKNMRRTLVLPKGVTLKEVSHSLANQELATYIDKNREDIINLLKVPKHELSLQESGSLGSEEAQTALKNFWAATLIPMMRIIEGELTKFFRRRGQLDDASYFLEFDLSAVDALKDNAAAKADLATKYLASGWTLNEVRSKVWELPEATEAAANVPFVIRPQGLPGFGFGGTPALPAPADGAPVEVDDSGKPIAAEAAEHQLTSPTQALNGAQVEALIGIVQQVTAGTLPRDAAVNIIRVSFALSQQDAEAVLGSGSISSPPPAAPPAEGAEGEEQLSTVAIATADVAPVVAAPIPGKAAKDKITNFLKGGEGWWSRREAHAREAIAKGTSELEKSTLKLFADMAVAITKTVKSHLKEKGWETLRTKADERAKLVGKPELRRRLRKALDKFEDRWIDDTRKALVARMDAGYDVALEVPFNMPSENEIAGLRERGAKQREDALEEREGRAFAYINETTIESVYSTIESGIDSGKTVQEIAQDLRDNFSDVAQIGQRAMMIARTETLTAVSLGQAAAMKDAAKLIPDLMKMWVTANDDRVRDSHEALHGDVVKHDEEFANGLQFPRDPSGPASEIIQCRCTVIMVPKNQMQDIDDSLEAEEEV